MFYGVHLTKNLRGKQCCQAQPKSQFSWAEIGIKTNSNPPTRGSMIQTDVGSLGPVNLIGTSVGYV